MAGSDSNSGTSPSSAWRTVGRVDQAALNPGDGVLFEGGQTFSDTYLAPPDSGTSSTPIVYGSFGTGNVNLPRGVYLNSVSGLTFDHLSVSGTGQGFLASGSGSGASHITIQNSVFTDVGIAINSANFANSDWTITANTIDQTGDSGMILQGDRFAINGNTITHTGTNSAIAYGKHGIYLKVINATVRDNTIRYFAEDGVSARYRNSVLEHNTISNGPIGIAWFQYDPVAGTSYWRYNSISATTAADIYVSPSDQAGMTRESFVITDNTLSLLSGVYMNLKPTTGTYTVCCNVP